MSMQWQLIKKEAVNLKWNVEYMRGLEEGKGGRKVNKIPRNKWKKCGIH